MFRNLIDILASPSSAFTRLREKPTWLAPLLLIIFFTGSIQVGYVYLVNREFMVDQIVDQAMAVNPNQDASLLRERMMDLSPLVLGIPGAIAVALMLLISTSLYAAYLNFISRFSSEDHGYRHWFSLVVWTSIPTIFVALAAWAVLLSSSTGQVAQVDLQVLSLGYLLGLDPGAGALWNLNIPQLWSLVLLILGYRHFTAKGMLKSALVVLAPMLLIYGLWAVFTL